METITVLSRFLSLLKMLLASIVTTFVASSKVLFLSMKIVISRYLPHSYFFTKEISVKSLKLA